MAKLASIEDILCRIDDLLRIVDDVPRPDFEEGTFQAHILAAAKEALEAEQERAQYFGPNMFLNPGWPILLQIFVAASEARDVGPEDLCAAAGVSETVALRHLAVLVSANLVRRQPRPSRPDSTYLALTAAGEKALCAYFSRALRERDVAAA